MVEKRQERESKLFIFKQPIKKGSKMKLIRAISKKCLAKQLNCEDNVGAGTVVEFNQLKRLLKSSAEKDDPRDYLQSLCFEVNKETGKVVTIVATDGYRLSYTNQNDLCKSEDECCMYLVGNETIKEVIKNSTAKSKITVSFEEKETTEFQDDSGINSVRHENLVHFNIDPCQKIGGRIFRTTDAEIITGKLIDSSFPNWRKVIPNYDGDYNLCITDVKALKNAVKNLKSLCVNKRNSRIQFNTKCNELILSTVVKEGNRLDTEVSEQVAIAASWKKAIGQTEVGFDAKYILKCLENLTDTEIKISVPLDTNDNKDSGLFETSEITTIIMPMRGKNDTHISKEAKPQQTSEAKWKIGMSEYRDVQSKLRKLRQEGTAVKCKLNSKKSVMLIELERIRKESI